jgi:predicted  nucleic acid-binding Zn ribbon protein
MEWLMTLETIELLSKEARRTSAFLLVMNEINFNHQSVQTLVEWQSSYISYLKECSSTQTKQTSTQLSLD